jgi:hypothetical protein
MAHVAANFANRLETIINMRAALPKTQTKKRTAKQLVF